MSAVISTGSWHNIPSEEEDDYDSDGKESKCDTQVSNGEYVNKYDLSESSVTNNSFYSFLGFNLTCGL